MKELIEQGRYQFICTNGCGSCGIKLSEFEYSRTEKLSGELVESKVHPKIVSACCNSEVEIWDTVDEEPTGCIVTHMTP